MNDQVVQETVLTPQQEMFLSKYLHIVPKSGLLSSKKRDRELQYNENLKKELVAYETRKRIVDDLIVTVGDKVRELAALSNPVPTTVETEELVTFRKAFEPQRDRFDRLVKAVATVHSQTITAETDAPMFVEGRVKLEQADDQLRDVLSRLPKAPAILTEGALPALSSAKAKIEDLKAFKGARGLDARIVTATLPDPEQERIRSEALRQHQSLCDGALKAIGERIAEALDPTPGRTPDVLSLEAGQIVQTLEKDIADPLKRLSQAIAGQAQARLEDLAKTSPTAAVEVSRLKTVDEKRDRIDALIKTLTEHGKTLKTEFAEATGFKEKQAIVAKQKEEKARIEALKVQKAQLDAYKDGLALRVGRIEEGTRALGRGAMLAKDPLGEIGKLAPLPKLGKEYETLLLGPADKDKGQGKVARGRYDELLDLFTRASRRVSVDAKLYPGEPDLTDINAEQFVVLKALLDKGKALAGEEAKKKEAERDFAKASHLMEEAYRLYFVFLSANKFALPPAAPVELEAGPKLDAALKTVGAELDDFWGRGGDADDALRKELALLVAEREGKTREGKESAEDLAELAGKVEAFRTKLALAASRFTDPVPGEDGRKAQATAKETRDEITKGLLDLYKTRPLQLAEIADVPPDRLLTVESGGRTQYYEIVTKREGTQERREDKDIPFEALNLLYQQSQMLDLLARESPMDEASAKQLEAESLKAKQTFDAIKNGGPAYKHIFEQIKEAKKLEAESVFKEWIPTGYYDLKTDLKAFEGEYATKYLPTDARKEIDRIHAGFTEALKKAGELKDAYKRAEKAIEAVEKDLDPKKATSGDKSPAVRLAAIIKAGPDALLKGVITAPEDFRRANELLEEMKAHLKTLGDTGIKGGLEGSFAREIEQARLVLETKTETGIASAEKAANEIHAAMKQKMGNLKPAGTLDYIEKLAAFLKDEATGAAKQQKDREDAETLRQDVKTRLADALKILDKEKGSLKSYKEYKTVYDGQNKGYETASKEFKDGTKPVSASLDQFRQQQASATQLLNDLRKLTVVKTSGDTVDFAGLQQALATNMKKVCTAAIGAANSLRRKAVDTVTLPEGPGVTEEDRKKAEARKKEVEEAVEAAAKVLELAGAVEVEKLVELKGDFAKAQAEVLKKAGEERRAGLARLRESVLAELRRIRAETEKHPALAVYRDNPMDRGASWPQFAASLHAFDVEVLTKLDPA